eukprot:CAMPEP_0119171986 /NCGR_PEP_ID=MMETSP1315-20130426/26991_1 /TAXON_ID=676789 /ORGANISM="Prasinoderma singularis, Strain RCC927" /LENGTH=47 /DNA_ID= /DNA_START= /DNA_END= /DNA_ORIENTATION=
MTSACVTVAAGIPDVPAGPCGAQIFACADPVFNLHSVWVADGRMVRP